ncbi:MAG: hypothetical protein E6J35_03430 [Chloroflexi bacterium]|nr:MAG: hypothetical protein E6J35_03430 [Chloroflexota bacterium]
MAERVSLFAPPDPESALWSAFGYDTICLFWGLPLRAFSALSEAERQGMVRVSNRIDDMSVTDKEPLLLEITLASPMKRLAIFRRLARALAGGRPIVGKVRLPGRRVKRSNVIGFDEGVQSI